MLYVPSLVNPPPKKKGGGQARHQRVHDGLFWVVNLGLFFRKQLLEESIITQSPILAPFPVGWGVGAVGPSPAIPSGLGHRYQCPEGAGAGAVPAALA